MKKTVTAKLEAEPMQWFDIPATVKAIKEVLPLMTTSINQRDITTTIATANAIMQTAADIRLTATLQAMNSKAFHELRMKASDLKLKKWIKAGMNKATARRVVKSDKPSRIR